MKRSEFIKRAAELPLFRKGVEDDFVRLCEEAGAIFDPEEEPLPERLWVEFDAGGRSFIRPEPPDLWRGEAQKRRSLERAVYRHNAWPELKGISGRLGRVAWGDDEDLGMIREALDAILDGKEQP